MVVLRPGIDNIDPTLISFGPLTKRDNCYYTQILYNGQSLYCQFNDWNITCDNDKYYYLNQTVQNQFIEQAIRQRLAEESEKMFKRGFTEEILEKMQKSMFEEVNSYTDFDPWLIKSYNKDGVIQDVKSGGADLIFLCESAVFEQSEWSLNWVLSQARQEKNTEVDDNYMFVDDVIEEDNDTDNGYESDNEHTEENFMFVPKPDNE